MVGPLRLSPRPTAPRATLWRLNATDSGPLNPLAPHQINGRLIREHYDDALRIAGSLCCSTTSSQLIRALRSQTQHLATLAQALQQIGRARIHLLDYCNDEQSTFAATASRATSATAAAASCASPSGKAKKNNSGGEKFRSENRSRGARTKPGAVMWSGASWSTRRWLCPERGAIGRVRQRTGVEAPG